MGMISPLSSRESKILSELHTLKTYKKNTIIDKQGTVSKAVYYLNEGKDINKAKEWMDKAMSMTDAPRFWHLRQQSLIYAKAGDKDGAIKAAKQSLAQAEKAVNADYVKMNKDSLKEWGAM